MKIAREAEGEGNAHDFRCKLTCWCASRTAGAATECACVCVMGEETDSNEFAGGGIGCARAESGETYIKCRNLRSLDWFQWTAPTSERLASGTVHSLCQDGPGMPASTSDDSTQQIT